MEVRTPRQTQCERVLDHMKTIGAINPKLADQRYGIMRLAARIKDLRDAGHRIKTTTMRSKNRDGVTVKWASYTLITDSAPRLF